MIHLNSIVTLLLAEGSFPQDCANRSPDKEAPWRYWNARKAPAFSYYESVALKWQQHTSGELSSTPTPDQHQSNAPRRRPYAPLSLKRALDRLPCPPLTHPHTQRLVSSAGSELHGWTRARQAHPPPKHEDGHSPGYDVGMGSDGFQPSDLRMPGTVTTMAGPMRPMTTE